MELVWIPVGALGALTAFQGVDLSLAFDGWATAIVFGIVWSLVFYVVTEVFPARRALRTSIRLICKELEHNFRLITLGEIGFIGFSFYEEYRSNVLVHIDESAGQALIYVYKAMELALEDETVVLRKARDIRSKLVTFAGSLSRTERERLLASWDNLAADVEQSKASA